MDKDIQKRLSEINDKARYNSTASLNRLIDETIEEFGGVKKVAEAMHVSYMTAKPGSAGQVRVLDGIIRMMLRRDGDDTEYEEMDSYTEKQLEGMLAEELGVDAKQISDNAPGPGKKSPKAPGGTSKEDV